MQFRCLCERLWTTFSCRNQQRCHRFFAQRNTVVLHDWHFSRPRITKYQFLFFVLRAGGLGVQTKQLHCQTQKAQCMPVADAPCARTACTRPREQWIVWLVAKLATLRANAWAILAQSTRHAQSIRHCSWTDRGPCVCACVGGVGLLLARYVLERVCSVNIGFGLFFSAVIANDLIGTPQHCNRGDVGVFK